MLSVKAARRNEREEGWEWQAVQRRPATGVVRSLGPFAICTTLAALGWFALPALAARSWDNTDSLPPAKMLLGLPNPATNPQSPSATLVQVAQKEGDAVVPPVKRQAPQTPAAAEPVPAPPAAPAKTKPADTAEKPTAKPEKTADKTSEPEASSWFDIGGIFAPVTEWLAKANREYQGRVVKQLSKPSQQELEAEASRLAAEKAAQEQQEAARTAEAAKQLAAEEARKKAEAEAARKAAEAAKEAEAKRQAEAAKTDAQRQAEAKKAAEAEAQKQAEAKKAAEAEAQRLREAARTADEKRMEQAKAEQAQKEQAEAARKAREAKLAEEQKAKAAAAQVQPAISKDSGERHRRWTITIIPEPIGRPEPASVSSSTSSPAPRVREANAVLLGAHQLAPRMGLGAGSLRGTAVKRWVWRAGSCRFAGRKVRKNERYTVARGDSLWRISELHYDEGARYPRIYRANRDRINDPNIIYPCQRFKVPGR